MPPNRHGVRMRAIRMRRDTRNRLHVEFFGLRPSARTHQSIGGRLATGSITADALAALGLGDKLDGGVVRDPAGVQGVVQESSLAPTPGVRASIFTGATRLGGLANVITSSRDSSRNEVDLEHLLENDLRYPLPSYKRTPKSKLILAATRPDVQRGRHKDDNFVEVERVPLGDLAMWFALQRYDYSADQYYHSKAVVSRYLGPSGDQRFNPGVRVPCFHWNPLVPKSKIAEWASGGTSSHPHGIKEVFRAFYSCNRCCQKVAVGKNSNGRTITKFVDATKYGKEKICSTQLKVVVRADDLTHAIIFQRGNHQGRTTSTDFLETAKILRAYARDQCERLGMTVAKVNQHMIKVTQTWQDESLFKLPLWRQIRTTDIKGIFRARSIRNGLIGDPLVALESLSVTRHYDPETMKGDDERGFVYFQPYIGPSEPQKTASKVKTKTTVFTSKPVKPVKAKTPKVKNAKALQSLLAVLAAASCCDDIVRWGRLNGIGIDSSHRHKCENRAPMSIMCTMADDGHVRIGPCAISSDITANTMSLYLKEAAAAIEKRAEVIVEAHKLGTPIGRDAKDQALLLAEAQLISENGWVPSHIMIDKSRSELNALQMWSDEMQTPINIRLCQFHIIQAILRWSADNPGQSERGSTKGIKISRIAKLEILDAFRVLQRYRVTRRPESPDKAAESEDDYAVRCDVEWKEAVHVFAERVNDLAIAYAEEGEADLWYQKVLNYFEDNWFTAEWRGASSPSLNRVVSANMTEYELTLSGRCYVDLWVDHGMPEGMTRDGFWGQNNRTERLFKFFDDVILGGTCNRRIDHLPLIIIDTLFAYFANFEAINDSIDKVLLAALDLGAEYWESAHFERELEFPRAYWVQPLGSEVAYLANLSVGQCPCTGFAMTGKRCAHMWAADFQDLNGNADEYNALSGRNFHHDKRSLSVPPREPEPWRELTDATVKVLTTISFRRPDLVLGAQGRGVRNPVAAGDLTASELAILARQDDEDDDHFDPVDDAQNDSDASAQEALNQEESGGDDDLEFAAESWAADEDLVLAAETWEAQNEFVVAPRIIGRPKHTKPMQEWRSSAGPVKTSLPSAGAERGIRTVMTIRGSDPDAVKPRTSTTKQTVAFSQKPGTKPSAKGANSLSRQVDLDILAELRDARQRVAALEVSVTKSQSVAKPKPRSKRANPQLPVEAPPPSSLYSSARRVPNAVRNRQASSTTSSQVVPRSSQASKASPGKAAAALAATQASLSPSESERDPYESDDGQDEEEDEDDDDEAHAVSAALLSLADDLNPRSKQSKDSRAQEIQEAWYARQAERAVDRLIEYPFEPPPPPGCACFHPDGHSFWERMHSISSSERTAVTNAFLHEFADIITPTKLSPELRSSERGKRHLTPITTPLGSYWVSPSVLHQVYQMNMWFDDHTMDAALSTINFWLGWTPGVVGWTPEAYVLPVGWKEDIAGVYFATDGGILRTKCSGKVRFLPRVRDRNPPKSDASMTGDLIPLAGSLPADKVESVQPPAPTASSPTGRHALPGLAPVEGSAPEADVGVDKVSAERDHSKVHGHEHSAGSPNSVVGGVDISIAINPSRVPVPSGRRSDRLKKEETVGTEPPKKRTRQIPPPDSQKPAPSARLNPRKHPVAVPLAPASRVFSRLPSVAPPPIQPLVPSFASLNAGRLVVAPVLPASRKATSKATRVATQKKPTNTSKPKPPVRKRQRSESPAPSDSELHAPPAPSPQKRGRGRPPARAKEMAAPQTQASFPDPSAVTQALALAQARLVVLEMEAAMRIAGSAPAKAVPTASLPSTIAVHSRACEPCRKSKIMCSKQDPCMKYVLILFP
ncbi:hypothetical protein P7C70_g884, partial [Phenoliferia sp. Uapishka_3]